MGAASPKARQAKSKARIQRYEELVAKAAEKGPTTAQIVIPIAERLGKNVIEFDGLKKGFADKLLIDGLSFKLPPGGIVGVIGPNGAGKTTLFRMITGQDEPDAGEIRVGETVQLGYVDQSRDTLDAGKTLYEEISGGNEMLYLGKREINARAYCSAFNFKGADQQKKVGVLSGGERNRVHLAKILKSGANVLLLDEPTNDLDVDTLRALEEALEDFAGCAVIITPRPLVPRPHRDPHAGLRGRLATSNGSRAISPITRRTRSGGSGRIQRSRIGSSTRSSRGEACARLPAQADEPILLKAASGALLADRHSSSGRSPSRGTHRRRVARRGSGHCPGRGGGCKAHAG